MTTPLPGCNCDNCKRWVTEAQTSPARLTPEEHHRRNQEYEAHRRAWRAEHPIIPIENDTRISK